MEGRGPQQVSAQLEQKAQPPSCKAFQTKVAALISRVRSIRDAPHKTLAHLIDKEWLDVLFCFQYRQDAINFLHMLKTRFKKFDLELNEEKTKLCRFGKYAKRDCTIRGEKRATFNFLGFTFYNGISRQGKYMVGCRTQSQRLNAAMNKVITWCKENRHQAIAWQARYLNAMLQEHYNYS